MRKKRGKRKGIPPILVIAGVIIIIAVFLILSMKTSPQKKEGEGSIFNSGKIKGYKNPESRDDYQNQNNELAENKDKVMKESGAGSSKDSDSKKKSICTMKQISYSIINLNKTSVCNQNQGSICVNKTVSCSIEINNRDDETSGFFEVKMSFLEKGKDREKDGFGHKTSKFLLGPGEKYLFEGSTSIQSTGEDGLANKEINCFYNTIEVPKKEVCF